MLTVCPECELQISDKAITCPHCGYPLKGTTRKYQRQSGKHKRLPNGFGQISEIKGRNLRNPWRAMVCVGKSDLGRPICRLLKPQAYFATYNDAYAALVEYNRNPYDLDDSITMIELWDRWWPIYSATLHVDASKRTVTSAWAYCSTIYKIRVKDLRARHIKQVMELGEYNGHTASAGTKARIKSVFNLMLDYAVEYELVDRNYSRTFNVASGITDEVEESRVEHITFTEDELRTLWSNISVPYVDMILIQCYSGWRPQELCELENINVDCKDWTMRGGMKTEAGTNRIVPIHTAIRTLVKKSQELSKLRGSDKLFVCTDSRNQEMTYDKYAKRFKKVVKMLGLNPKHRPHDPRKTFVTMAKNAGVDEYAIKRIVGHSIDDITEKVYTERDASWLRCEMEKLRLPE